MQGKVCLKNDEEFSYSHDLEGRQNSEALESRLKQKAQTVLGSKSDVLLSLYERFDNLSARELGGYLRSSV